LFSKPLAFRIRQSERRFHKASTAFELGVFLAASLTLGVRVAKGREEAQLRKTIEGKRITVQIDMPATSAGVDIYPRAARPTRWEV
jgi:hypothetical protein